MLAAIIVASLATSAAADAIDGDWCLETRHLKIDGPQIVTPGGNAISGDYTRHTFAYVTPAGESGAGERIDMTLINDDMVELRRGSAGAEVWRRCKPIS